ncbi:hypothetical protein Tco_1007237, partial [Tanacetum coccineum]
MLVCRTKTLSYLALGYNVGCTTLHASKPQWAAAAVAAFRPAKNMSTTLCLDIVYLRAVHFGRTIGLSLVSSPLHAMKSPSQIQSSAAVKFGGVTEVPKIRIEANNQEKKALEVVSRRTNPKTTSLTHFSSSCVTRPLLSFDILVFPVRVDNIVLPYGRISLDILLPSIRFPL